VKILWAHSHFGAGGGPKTILTWAIGLKELGHEISFIGTGGRLLDSVMNNNFKFIPLPEVKFRPSIIHTIKMYKICTTVNPDVIVSVGIHTSLEASIVAYLFKKPILYIFNVSPRDRMWISNEKWKFPQTSDMVVVNEEFKKLCVIKYGWDESQIHYIPERLFKQTNRVNKANNNLKKICIIRRLDSIKSKPVIEFLNNILQFLQKNDEIEIDIIGDGVEYTKVNTKSDQVNSVLKHTAIKCLGYIDEIEKELHSYDLVIGTEKVIIESLLSCRYTAILKENGEILPVTMDNVEKLSESNFIGDTFDDLSGLTLKDSFEQLKLLTDNEINSLSKWAENHYDYKIGVNKISNLLNDVSPPKYFFRKFFPQMMKLYISIIVKSIKKVVK